MTAKDVEARLAGPFVLVRGMYGGERLDFDAQGNLVGSAQRTALTLSAITDLKIRMTDAELEVAGKRAGLEFDAATPDAPVMERSEGVGKHDKLVVRIARDPRRPEELSAALNKVFAVGFDDALVDSAPDYWQPWLRHDLHPGDAISAPPFAAGVAKFPMRGVTPPRLTFDPDPEFSDSARRRKFKGTFVAGLIVDENGNPQHVYVVRPLGMGLDELAIAAVKRYRFMPAMRDGAPVAVLIHIEVNFRIY